MCERLFFPLLVTCPQSVFNRVSSARKSGIRTIVRVTYIEIYNEEALDLLGEQQGRRSLAIRERADGAILITGANETVVTSAASALDLFDAGNHARTVGPTNMNAQSSRSHAIMTVTIEQQQQLSHAMHSPATPASAIPPAEWITTSAKFHLVHTNNQVCLTFHHVSLTATRRSILQVPSATSARATLGYDSKKV